MILTVESKHAKDSGEGLMVEVPHTALQPGERYVLTVQSFWHSNGSKVRGVVFRVKIRGGADIAVMDPFYEQSVDYNCPFDKILRIGPVNGLLQGNCLSWVDAWSLTVSIEPVTDMSPNGYLECIKFDLQSGESCQEGYYGRSSPVPYSVKELTFLGGQYRYSAAGINPVAKWLVMDGVEPLYTLDHGDVKATFKLDSKETQKAISNGKTYSIKTQLLNVYYIPLNKDSVHSTYHCFIRYRQVPDTVKKNYLLGDPQDFANWVSNVEAVVTKQQKQISDLTQKLANLTAWSEAGKRDSKFGSEGPPPAYSASVPPQIEGAVSHLDTALNVSVVELRAKQKKARATYDLLASQLELVGRPGGGGLAEWEMITRNQKTALESWMAATEELKKLGINN